MKYNVTLKDGKEYKVVEVCNEKGELSSGLFSVLRDDPSIFLLESAKESKRVHNVRLPEIKSFMRLDALICAWPYMMAKGGEELPVWIAFYETYLKHKAELDPLPRKEKVALARRLREAERGEHGTRESLGTTTLGS